MGLLQKTDKIYITDSVDRIIGYTPKDPSEPKLMLCDMKARVASTISRQERERILKYHDDEKYTSTYSISLASWYCISKLSERLHMLHNYYTYKETGLLYIVGDTQHILSQILIEIDPNLLESYYKLLSHLFSLSIKQFYDDTNISTMDTETNDNIKEGISIHRTQLVDYNTTNQRHMLWHKLTSLPYITT